MTGRAYDIEGDTFGKLTAKSVTHVDGKRSWVCECECGGQKTVPTYQLTNGVVKSCGCLITPDLVGNSVGMLEVVERVPKDEREYRNSVNWRCRCKCGSEVVTPTVYITQDKIYSCGCERRPQDTGPRKPPEVTYRNKIYWDYKSNASDREMQFELTKDDVGELIGEDCYYCGRAPHNEMDREEIEGSFLWNGIDRLNNSKGYFQENVVTCCSECNTRKYDSDVEEFEQWVEMVYNNFVSEA